MPRIPVSATVEFEIAIDIGNDVTRCYRRAVKIVQLFDETRVKGVAAPRRAVGAALSAER